MAGTGTGTRNKPKGNAPTTGPQGTKAKRPKGGKAKGKGQNQSRHALRGE